MKILVTVKRVEDPQIKIKIRSDGMGIESEQMKYVVNPFDEIAVEEALRVRDAQQGEVVVVTCGNKEASQQLRTALAMGADRAIHIVSDQALDPLACAHALAHVVRLEAPDLVLLGKQAIDDDMGQTGIMLAELLGWGHASCASKEVSLDSDDEKNKVAALQFEDGRVHVVREVDGGIETLQVALPAIVTTELRLNVPRYASLPGIMKAKKKEIREVPWSEAGAGTQVSLRTLKMATPSQRQSGVRVADVASLMQKLRQEAKVI